MRKWLVLSAMVVVVDQLSKQLAITFLSLHTPVAIIPSFNLTLVYNTGASFGLLADAGGWQRWGFIALALVICTYLFFWLKRLSHDDLWSGIGIACIIGGALGNSIDRIFYGYVIDFLDVYYNHYHWPTFNFADSAICFGALVVIAIALFESKTSVN